MHDLLPSLSAQPDERFVSSASIWRMRTCGAWPPGLRRYAGSTLRDHRYKDAAAALVEDSLQYRQAPERTEQPCRGAGVRSIGSMASLRSQRFK